MKYYFIGVNKTTENLITTLMVFGATLMFRYHFKTMELNREFGFYDGEWLLLTCAKDDHHGIDRIREFLNNERLLDNELEFTIIQQ